jgi:hemoglobin
LRTLPVLTFRGAISTQTHSGANKHEEDYAVSVLHLDELCRRSSRLCRVSAICNGILAETLYQCLGGYDALAAVNDDFITHLATDPELGRFFTGLSNDSKVRVRQHVIDFLCVATGGPCKYTGRGMKTAHTGLNISQAEWNKSVQYLVGTLDKFKVPEKEKSEVLGAISGLKGDIVGR